MQRPLTVIMDLTERCNLRCVMCYFSETDRLSFLPHDRSLSDTGMMPVPVFEKIASDLFPRAWRVSLGCATEPMIHPKFREIIEIAGRYRVPDLWFPTNLLALTEKTAEALVDNGVSVVGASIDGLTRETYEKIRVGGKWDRLLEKLQLLRDVRKAKRLLRPSLRLIFTWMKSNREQLAMLPEFCRSHGIDQIDVRYVTPTVGVDVSPELLDDEDPAVLRAELGATARNAVRLGIRLQSYPEFETRDEISRGILPRISRRLWRIRAGLDRKEYRSDYKRQQANGCAYPDSVYVVRPNGAVSPCVFWEGAPIGFYPEDSFASISSGTPLSNIREGLACGSPVGSCATCDQRRDAFYRPGNEPEVEPRIIAET